MKPPCVDQSQRQRKIDFFPLATQWAGHSLRQPVWTPRRADRRPGRQKLDRKVEDIAAYARKVLTIASSKTKQKKKPLEEDLC